MIAIFCYHFLLSIYLTRRVFHARTLVEKNAAGGANRFPIFWTARNLSYQTSNFSYQTSNFHLVLISRQTEMSRCNSRDILTGATNNGNGCAIIHIVCFIITGYKSMRGKKVFKGRHEQTSGHYSFSISPDKRQRARYPHRDNLRRTMGEKQPMKHSQRRENLKLLPLC